MRYSYLIQEELNRWCTTGNLVRRPDFQGRQKAGKESGWHLENKEFGANRGFQIHSKYTNI